MSIFGKCKHKWEVIQEVTTKSRAELQGECTGEISSPYNDYQHRELYKRKFVTIVQCDNCGTLKRFVEEI